MMACSKQAYHVCCIGLRVDVNRRLSVYDMSVVLVATHQHVMTDKWTNVMILSGTINTRRRLVNVTLSSRNTFLLRDVICYPDKDIGLFGYLDYL
jgi:DUF1009 family protein